MAKARVGFIGLGIMGSRMAARVLEAGWPLSVWNRDAAKMAPLREAGAEVAASPSELAARCEVILVCVFDAESLEAVLFGPDGVGGTVGGACRTIVDHTTIPPAAARELAGRLEAEVGIDFIDAPVTGGPQGAADGTLGVFAGGAEAAIERTRPLVESYARRYVRMGPSGAGAATKMVNQVAVLNTIPILAEMIRLAEANGVDALRLPEVLEGGYADSRLLQLFGPRMARRDDERWSRLRTGMKDLDLVLATARDAGVSLPHTALSQQLWRLLIARGLGDADTCQWIRLYE